MAVHICDFSSWGHTEANDCQDFALFLLDFNAFQMLEPEMKRGENIHLCFPYKSEDTSNNFADISSVKCTYLGLYIVRSHIAVQIQFVQDNTALASGVH